MSLACSSVWRSSLWVALLLAALLRGHAAVAQPAEGFYLGGAVGYGLLQDQRVTVTPASAGTGKVSFDGGIAAVGGVGYGFGNGLRVQLEGDYRANNQRGGRPGYSNGSEVKYGGMGNLLFDLDFGIGWMTPYIGGGAGYQVVDWRGIGLPAARVNQSVGGLAYQAILGASFPIGAVPGLAITLEYRYLAVAGARDYRSGAARVRSNGDDSHTVLVGVRYSFDGPSGADLDARPPLAQTSPPALSTRTYLIYFDDQSVELTARARDVLAEAIRASTQVGQTRVELAGNVGTTAAVSLQRARNVAAAMERSGVPAGAIDLHDGSGAKSSTDSTVGGAKPASQRVEIVYR